MNRLSHWLVALIALFAPIQAAAIVAIVLIIADLITGVLAAKKRSEPITSSGLKQTIYKFLIYEVAILLGFLTQTYLTKEILPVSNLVTAVVGLTELKSILENLDTISGGSFFESLIAKVSKTKDTLVP